MKLTSCLAAAGLALLAACGGDDHPSSTVPPKATAKSDTSRTEKTVEPLPPLPSKTTPTPAPTPLPPTAKPTPAPQSLPVTPPDDETAPGIVHTNPAEPPLGDTPLSELETDDSLLLDAPRAGGERAVATLSPASTSQVTGTVTFVAQATGVEVRVQLEGLTPGKHALHVHEVGDCSASDASSAGGHFNPGSAPHGGPDSSARHAGDLGNVEADAAGRVDTTFLDRSLALTGTGSIVGRSIVVHAEPDDLVTQPDGAAGTRIACGVIEHQAEPDTTPGG